MPRRRSDYYEDAHDERVEPHIDLMPEGIGDPDWARVLVNTGERTNPVGDPTMWGNSVETLIDDDPVLGNTPRRIDGNQILLAQSADRYSRSWSLTGTLAVRGFGWRLQNGVQPGDAVVPPAEGMNVFLSVISGMGQASFEQIICLACNGFPTNIGLCWNQSSVSASSGPYTPGYSPVPPTFDSYIILPFACIGAFVGKSISVRALYLRGGNAVGGAIPRAIMSCMLTPYAPGQGM